MTIHVDGDPMFVTEKTVSLLMSMNKRQIIQLSCVMARYGLAEAKNAVWYDGYSEDTIQSIIDGIQKRDKLYRSKLRPLYLKVLWGTKVTNETMARFLREVINLLSHESFANENDAISYAHEFTAVINGICSPLYNPDEPRLFFKIDKRLLEVESIIECFAERVSKLK